MARALARLSGVMIKPGVSKNQRGYSKPLLADAMERLQKRIADGTAPVSIYTSHGAADDDLSEKIVGRVNAVSLGDDGEIRYEATLADSALGRDILALVDTDGDADPYLSGVSIRGCWIGDVGRTELDGIPCTAGEALEIEGLDFTSFPGVDGARVDVVTRDAPAPAESGTGRPRHRIYESIQEARITVTEEAAAAAVAPNPAALAPTFQAAAPAAAVTPTQAREARGLDGAPAAQEQTAPGAVVERWADHGYTAAGKRWPLDTASQAREAWRQLRRPAVAETLTAAQLRRTRERATKALQRHGIEVLQGGWLLERAQPTPGPVREYLDWYDGPINVEPEPVGSFTARIDNGTVCVSISSWAIDPHDLTRVARAAMAGAADAMDGLDPDMDGDVDTDVALPGENAPQRRPSATETAPAESGVAEEAPADEAPVAPVEPSPDVAAAAPVSTEQEGDPGMAEATDNTAAAPTAPAAPTFTFDQVKDLFGSFGAGFAQAQAAPVLAGAGVAAESAPAAAAPVVETAVPATPAAPAAAPAAPVVEKTQAQLIAEAVEAGRRSALQDLAEAGLVARKGAAVAGSGVRETDVAAAADDLASRRPSEAEWKAIKSAMGAEMAADFGILRPQA